MPCSYRRNSPGAGGHTAAIQRNDAFFYYYLQRGLVAEASTMTHRPALTSRQA